MRILFAGSPEIAVPSLVRVNENFDIAAVLTNPDKITGRGRVLLPNAVKVRSVELGLPVIQPVKLDEKARREVTASGADILVVFAYGKIFGQKFLDLFPLGGINVHPSLLPRYRGSSPIPSVILGGDKVTGVTIQKINLEMDTGAIFNQQTINLDGTENTETLSLTASRVGADLLVETLKAIESGRQYVRAQSETDVSYCKKIEKNDGLIDWKENSELIDRRIRAYFPWPRAYTTFNGKILMILNAAPYTGWIKPPVEAGTVLGFDKGAGILIQTGNGVIAVQSLQLQSKKAHDWKTFLNGTQNFAGSLLGGN